MSLSAIEITVEKELEVIGTDIKDVVEDVIKDVEGLFEHKTHALSAHSTTVVTVSA